MVFSFRALMTRLRISATMGRLISSPKPSMAGISHDIHDVSILHRLRQLAGGIHGGRTSRILPGSIVENFADTIAPGIQICKVIQTLSQIAQRQFLLGHTDSFFTKQITARVYPFG